jgi:hypothetical protein
VIVPLVAKLADAEFATATFPDALTLDSTVPRFTVAVRRDPAELDEPVVKPYTEFREKNTTTAAMRMPDV